MTFKRMGLILLTAVYISTSSCNSAECHNTNPVFEQFSFDTKEYKKELANQIQNIGAENLSYSHDRYLVKDGREYLVTFVQGAGLCAKAAIEVNDWRKLAGLRREVSGYRGAGLRGLTFEIREDSTMTHFLFKDVERIID